MIYLGFFSFDGEDSEGEECYGHFVCVAEATKPEDAIDKFEEHIRDERKSGQLFQKSKFEIYLRDVIEIHKKPTEATILSYHQILGESPPTLHCNLPSKNSESCRSYEWHHEDISDEEFERVTEGTYETEPFIKFD